MVTPRLSSISGNFSRAGASKKQIDSLKGVSLLMKKHLLPLFLCLSLLTGCAAAGAAAQSVPKAAGDVSIPVLDADSHPDTSYAAFAAELLRQSRTEGENTLLSPLSVMLALGMTANGASGETLAGFRSLFGMDLDALNAYCASALSTYSKLGGSTQATLVNSLWCDPDLTLEDRFVARCQQNYGAELYQADLSSAATVKAVNDWVKEATKGLIPNTVDQFSEDAVLALVNAIYLNNRFERPFEAPVSDWEMDFTAEDGTVSRPKGMSNGIRTEQYIAARKGQGVVLPYDDGHLGFLLMLPDEGVSLTAYLASWNGETTGALLKARQEARVSLVVPKFEVEWSGSLGDTLAAMGLADAFDPSAADFSAMGSVPGKSLCVGDVIHKTVLKVNEKGTEAAAVTAAVMKATSAAPAEDPIVLRFDRPFVCGIVDLETGAPLFLGTVENLT